MSLSYRIVFPRGDRSRLAVVQVRDYETSDWALASREEWPNTNEGEAAANEYAEKLAEKHGLPWKNSWGRTCASQRYLD